MRRSFHAAGHGLALLLTRASVGYAGDGLLGDDALSLWSFVTFALLVMLMVGFSVIVRSYFLPKQPDRKRGKPEPKGPRALPSSPPRQALPPAEPGSTRSESHVPQRAGRGSVASMKKQVAQHAADLASIKSWCEQQDPDRALAVIRRWLKAELDVAKTKGPV